MIIRGDGRKIYVAGPMTGYVHCNFPAFDRATAMLRDYGWIVFSPAEAVRAKRGHDIVDMSDDRDEMRDNLIWICDHADALYMLRAWEDSGGAFTEWALGRRLRLLFFYET